jgi:hypothetical protein
VDNTTAQLHENSIQTSIHNQQLIGKRSLLQFTQNFTYAAWKQDNLPSLAGLGTYIQIEHCYQRYSSAISPPVTAALQAEADGNIGTEDSGPAGVHW